MIFIILYELYDIAMIEQELKDGKFNTRRTNRNGATAVVYYDNDKWNRPLIDITSQYYSTDEAKQRINELKNKKYLKAVKYYEKD